MNISCKVIEDLLPLYHDNVCSQESRALVDSHLTQCESCKAVLNGMMAEIEIPQKTANDKKALEGISAKWKKSNRRALIAGIGIALAVALLLFAQISVSWYRGTALFYIELGERMGVNAAYPHDYGPTTPEQAEEIPPKYLFPKEYFLGTSEYAFWLRTPTFLDSHGSMIVEPAEAYGEITDKYGNVISRRTIIYLTIHFTDEKVPEYYVTLMNDAEDLDTLLVFDGNCSLLHTEDYRNKEDLLQDQAIADQYQEEIKGIIGAAKDVWGLA